ncbi:hypothetical protein [Aquimarina spongiae]|uniref:Histidine kinase n=1 Tax=Aquimarina spongiae TaxID=570521 RepID=A0A1M6A8Z6_9FLAO|nr:hypothetical protein [Aquimarina spongiae]SHI32896.1 hypothetical protein SAMN04488508_101162 [Aquimarina spongiae]
MNKYRLTLIGLVLSIFIYFTSTFLELNLFQQFVSLLNSIQELKLEGIVIPFIIFSVFVIYDIRQRIKKVKMENAKQNIYKAMLSSSHHILNNFIYQMDLFKITAEDTPGFDSKVLAFYEDIISDASDQIDSLSNLTSIDEFSIRSSVMRS